MNFRFLKKIKNRFSERLSDDSGFAMAETLMAIGVMAIAGGIYAASNNMQNRENIRTQMVATQMKTVATAASQYAKANSSALLASLSPGANGIPVSLSTLETSGFLPPGFNAVNPWGQSIGIEYYEPVAGNIAVVVYTSGGTPMSAQESVLSAKLQGAEGGYVPDSNLQSAFSSQGICQGSCVQGAGNAWQFPMSTISVPTTPGHLVTYASLNRHSLVHDTLYRYPVPGNLNANTMATNINFANGGTITGIPNVTPGQACSSNNAIGVYNNTVITCVSGTWQQNTGGQWGQINPGQPGVVQYTNGGLNTNGQPINSGSQAINGSTTYPQNGSVYTASNGLHWIWAQPELSYASGFNSSCGPCFCFMKAGSWGWYQSGSIAGSPIVTTHSKFYPYVAACPPSYWNTVFGTVGYILTY